MAKRGTGQGAAAPQMSYCLAAGAVGRFTSFDGNIGGSKFKNQLIDKLTRNLKRLDLDRVAKISQKVCKQSMTTSGKIPLIERNLKGYIFLSLGIETTSCAIQGMQIFTAIVRRKERSQI